jgi:hypothetical protein
MKQKKNKWLDRFITFLFATGIFGACVSIACGAFKIHPIAGYFVVSFELIVLASILHDIKDE